MAGTVAHVHEKRKKPAQVGALVPGAARGGWQLSPAKVAGTFRHPQNQALPHSYRSHCPTSSPSRPLCTHSALYGTCPRLHPVPYYPTSLHPRPSRTHSVLYGTCTRLHKAPSSSNFIVFATAACPSTSDQIVFASKVVDTAFPAGVCSDAARNIGERNTA
jgi:hypothetical protein